MCEDNKQGTLKSPLRRPQRYYSLFLDSNTHTSSTTTSSLYHSTHKQTLQVYVKGEGEGFLYPSSATFKIGHSPLVFALFGGPVQKPLRMGLSDGQDQNR